VDISAFQIGIARSLAEFVSLTKSVRLGIDDPWFRGHARSSWELKPLRFREPYARMGDRDEFSMMSRFMSRAIPFCDPLPRNEWDWAMLARHHGVPTRLLDWSLAALAGLYFAVAFAEIELTEDACVWILKPMRLNSLAGHEGLFPGRDVREPAFQNLFPAFRGAVQPPPKPVCVDGQYITPRLAAQRGAFVLFGSDADGLRSQGEADLARPLEERVLSAILIPRQHVRDLRGELFYAGITEAVMFPGLDGVARELSWDFIDRFSVANPPSDPSPQAPDDEK
jgi:hypothetical protein